MSLPPASRLGRYFSVISRWFATTFVVFIITLWAGKYLFDHVIPKTYVATAKLRFQLPQNSGKRSDGLIKAEEEKIVASDTLLPVVYDLELEKNWAPLLSSTGEEVVSGDDVVPYLKRRLRLTAAAGSDTVEINAYSPYPKEAADIANAIATHFKSARETLTSSPPEIPVQIVEMATISSEPVRPNRTIIFYVTVGAAVILSILAACFLEVVLLFIRAGQDDGT
jgi:capsular polysaccharide biosynthesis protein